MRQIQICAWLSISCVALAACGGEKFASGDANGNQSAGPTVNTPAGASNHNQAGSASSHGGSEAFDSAGKSASGGFSSGGGAAAGSSAGGAASSGGSSKGGDDGESSGGEASADCPSGTITFRMLPGPDLTAGYLCDAGCGTGWLSITDADGALAYTLFSACGTASCNSCEVQACAAAACLPTPLTAEGSELKWTGTYLAKATCGANMTCQRPDCVKPGKYKAKACAAVSAGNSSMGAGCMPKDEQLCAEAVFEFPATETVTLVLKK